MYTIFMVKIRSKFPILSGIFIVALLLLGTGCTTFFVSEPEPTLVPITGQGSPEPLQGTGVLACNTDCADQAQCGANAELGQVVLLSASEPRLNGHDLIGGNNTAVEIRASQNVEVIRPGDPNTQFMRFYKVALNDGTINRGEAWVAGWCIQAPQP